MAASPKVPTNRSADASATFPVSTVAEDLTAVVGKPPFAPQLVQLRGSAVVGAATLVDEEGESHPVVVPINSVVPFPIPVATLTTDGNCSATAFWWERGTVIASQYPVAPRNPAP